MARCDLAVLRATADHLGAAMALCHHADGHPCLFCEMGLPLVRVHPAAAQVSHTMRRTLTIASTERVREAFGDPGAYSSALVLELRTRDIEPY